MQTISPIWHIQFSFCRDTWNHHWCSPRNRRTNTDVVGKIVCCDWRCAFNAVRLTQSVRRYSENVPLRYLRFPCCVCCVWRFVSHAKCQTQTSRTMHSYETVLLGAINASDSASDAGFKSTRGYSWLLTQSLAVIWGVSPMNVCHFIPNIPETLNKWWPDNDKMVLGRNIIAQHYINDGETMTR